MSTICETLKISRATAYRVPTVRAAHYVKAEDRVVAAQIRTVVRERASYGYRRITAVVNRGFAMHYNRKRIRRVMAIEQWTLPRPMKRRSTRAHRGLVQRPFANERWSSDAIEIACWNGEVVEIAFALDCCDRECLAWVASSRKLSGEDIRTLVAAAVRHRFGDLRPAQPIQWLSDNGTIYTALETVIAAEQLGLAPITTPVRSPESNGISEAFHHTIRRDYEAGADLSSAAAVIAQIPAMGGGLQSFCTALESRDAEPAGVPQHAGDCVRLGQRVSHELGSTTVQDSVRKDSVRKDSVRKDSYHAWGSGSPETSQGVEADREPPKLARQVVTALAVQDPSFR